MSTWWYMTCLFFNNLKELDVGEPLLPYENTLTRSN